MKRKPAVAVAAVVSAGVLGWGIPALAADESPSPSDTPSESSRGAEAEERHDAMRAELAERLAAELGLDTAEVEAALEKVGEELRAERDSERLAGLEERLDAAVEEGRLTREQADELLESAAEGDLRGGMRHLHRGQHGFGGGPGLGAGPDGSAGPQQAPGTPDDATDSSMVL